MPKPEYSRGQDFEEFSRENKRPESKPITSEQSEQASGEIGKSGHDPIEYFEKEYNSLGESFKGGLGLGSKDALMKWDQDAKAHNEKRRKLEGIIEGLKSNNSESINSGIDYLNDLMTSHEEELAPLASKESGLNDNINNMKQAEMSGDKDFGYLKFHAKNQELDVLYKKLNKEKQLAEPNKFRLREINDDISEAKYVRDNTEFGGKAGDLRNIQEAIERINSERNKLDILINQLKKKE